MRARREFLSQAAVFLMTAACSPEKLFGPCSTDDEPQGLDALPPLTDVWINDGEDLDSRLSSLLPTPSLAVHLTGSFQTKGVYRWGRYATRNLGRDWTVDGDAEISLVPDSIKDSQPLFCLAGPARKVSGIKTRGNHSVLVEKSSGSLRTGGVLIEGSGSIDHVTFKDFGSRVDETFVGVIDQGSGPASITNCVFTDFDPSSSDTQVTVFMIDGARSFAFMEGNETQASGPDNWVQGHTIYQASKGLVRRNRTHGSRFGYYGDFWATRGIVIEDNDFDLCEHGVQLNLSPSPKPYSDAFSHQGYRIGVNRIHSRGTQVSLNTCGPNTATRFIKDIEVDSSLSLENYGATNVTRPLCRMAA